MTSDLVDSQWLSSANASHARHSNLSTVSPVHHPFHFLGESSRKTGVVSTNVDQAVEPTEPASKRQKTEHDTPKFGSGLPFNSAVPQYPWLVDKPSDKSSESSSTFDPPLNSRAALKYSDTDLMRRGPTVLPQRPKKASSRNVNDSKIVSTVANVQTKPYVAEQPAPAPRFKYGGPADFHPWTGHHSEDILNESTTKNGLYDKPQAIQNESATARPAIWSSLKHKSGLPILSSLLVSALDQRQAHGTIAASCTFKPPPRVTLTDTKREAWLRDLADPDIPLRRLSRTIPHGIRGKVLLDHCLGKMIPTTRAVWLAKCVGANEIRAFKRKGAGGAFAIGGEAKWIKDWTANVEQFLEIIVGRCGDVGWKMQVDYGLRLASHLASERLLDQAHYRNWLISSVRKSDLETLSIWILMVQMHRNELLQERQHGRHCVQVLLEQLQKATEPMQEGMYATIVPQLAGVIKSVIVSSPSCLVSPQMWDQYETLLWRTLGDNAENLSESLDHLARRNKGLRRQNPLHAMSSKRRIIHLLDMAFEDVDIASLSDTCLALVRDTDSVVTTYLQWGSTLYRTGNARLYLTVRLLRTCNVGRSGLGAAIMRFMSRSVDHIGLSKSSLFRILAELFRSKHLDVGKYLQWLMAKGSPNGASALTQHGPCDVRLLFELPTHDLLPHISNLRSIMLSKIGASVEDEIEILRSVQGSIAKQIPNFFSTPRTDDASPSGDYTLMQLSIPIKTAVAQWIRQAVASRSSQKRSHCNNQTEEQLGTSHLLKITSDQFKAIRRVLEDLEDFAALVDVLEFILETNDITILTSACDTMCYHLSIFAAMGALPDLFSSMVQQYKHVSKNKPADQGLIESMIDLGKCIPNTDHEVRLLRTQLRLHRRKAAASACSPISDHMTEALQSAEPTFPDEVDQVLASGTSIDKQNLAQLFDKVVQGWEQPQRCSKEHDLVFPELLSRLRPFDPDHFEVLVASWIGRVLRSSTEPGPPTTLPIFITSGCVTLDKVLRIAQDALHDLKTGERHTRIAMDVLELLATSKVLRHNSLSASKSYRLRWQVVRVLRRDPAVIIPFLLPTFEAYSAAQVEFRNRANTLIFNEDVQNLIKTLAVRDPESLQSIRFSTGVAAILDKLIPLQHLQIGAHEQSSDPRHILCLVNLYNLPLCQLKLKTMFSTDATASGHAASTLSGIVSSDAEFPSSDFWPELVSALPPEQGDYIRQCLERDILSRISYGLGASTAGNVALIGRTLSVIDAIGADNACQTSFPLITQMAEKFSHALTICRPLATGLDSPCKGSSSEGPCILRDTMYHIDVLLRLLNIHQATVQRPNFPQSTLIQLHLSLTFLLIHPALNTNTSVTSRLHDTLLVLSDSLSEESRANCIRTLRDYKIRDPRVCFVFGYSEPTDDEWLQAVTNPSTRSDSRPAGPSSEQMLRATQPYPVRRWEMMQDATPLMGVNDTSLSLTLFGARKAVL